MKMSLRTLIYPIIALTAFGLDFLSKIAIQKNMTLYQSQEIIGEFLKFTFVLNKGITFGMFNNANGNSPSFMPVILVVMAFTAMLIVLYLFFNLSKYLKDGIPQEIARVAIMFVVGGALGNIVDRMINKAVVDFIDMGIGNLRWFTYNVADSFVVVGAIILGVLFVFFEKKEHLKKESEHK